MTDRTQVDQLTDIIIGSAIEVHRALGPGLSESAYESCLVFELRERGLKVEQQEPLPVVYRQVKLDCGYRLDLLVEETVIVEVKAVDRLAPFHQAQILSYLKLSGLAVGPLINFNVRLLKQGVRRVVNGLPESPRSLRSQRCAQNPNPSNYGDAE
ncbi:MAG: GxxExxY protein [SAR202 cluster bacterium Io17-Chloro-G9]|nr:MAG: GxxExxY protein [SAR202 cluster bacterium Io17-Chloro-G9]